MAHLTPPRPSETSRDHRKSVSLAACGKLDRDHRDCPLKGEAIWSRPLRAHLDTPTALSKHPLRWRCAHVFRHRSQSSRIEAGNPLTHDQLHSPHTVEIDRVREGSVQLGKVDSVLILRIHDAPTEPLVCQAQAHGLKINLEHIAEHDSTQQSYQWLASERSSWGNSWVALAKIEPVRGTERLQAEMPMASLERNRSKGGWGKEYLSAAFDDVPLRYTAGFSEKWRFTACRKGRTRG